MPPAASEIPEDKAPQKPPETEPRRNGIAEWTVTAILFVFLITTLLQGFVIPTVSMEDTLLRGDHLLVDKLAYGPCGVPSRYLLPYREVRRGDIVVFRWPIDIRQNYVKRVIGVPGDRIRIVNKVVYLDGKPLNEPFAIHRSAYTDSYRDNFPAEPNVGLPEPALQMLEHDVKKGEVVVPESMYFAMGDNRDNSADSRYWGFVPRENIVGKPLLIWWSYDAPTAELTDANIVSLSHLSDLARHFFTKTRWSRTLRFIRSYPLQ
jgi:signal peptidase I